MNTALEMLANALTSFIDRDAPSSPGESKHR
jgi:hypothetical protein